MTKQKEKHQELCAAVMKETILSSERQTGSEREASRNILQACQRSPLLCVRLSI